MNKDWAEKNKRMQSLIGKEASFREGLDVLFELRDELFGQILKDITARRWLIPCGTSSGSRILSPIH